MALQPFQVSDGSTIFWDDKTQKIMTEGGKNDSFYTAGSVDQAQQVWNQRLANKSGKSGSGGNTAQPTNQAYAGGVPTVDLNAVYDQVMNTPEYQQLKKQYDEKQKAYNDSITGINDNPFYSEATRGGKIARLNDTSQRDLELLANQIAEKKADAQVRVNLASQQYNINNQAYTNALSKLDLLLKSNALEGMSTPELTNLAVQTGLTVGQLKSITEASKQANVKPQVITNTDDYGNVTITVVDANTGNIINNNSLGGVGKTSGSNTTNEYKPGTATYKKAVDKMTKDLLSVMGKDRRVSPTDYITYRSQWIEAGFNPSDFDSSFKTFINPTHAQDYLVGYNNPLSDTEQLLNSLR